MSNFSDIVPPEPQVLDDLRDAMAHEGNPSQRKSIADQNRTRTPRCPACNQKIVWVPTAASGGTRHTMCDPEWHRGDGKKTLVTRDGQQIVEAGPEVLGREPHWGTCPEKERLQKLTKKLNL